MLAAGFTAVGEFHYLGESRRRAAAEAAAEAGIGFVSSTWRTRAAGSSGCASRRSPRTSARSSGCGPPGSTSASPPTPSARARATGSRRSAATPRRRARAPRARRRAAARDRGVPRRARRPPDRAARRDGLPHRADDGRPRDARGRRRARPAPRSGATVCACPTTEADLGDGFIPAVRMRHRGIPLCIGSDSNVRIDPLEELRELEGIARRQSGKRGVFSTEDLLAIGGAERRARARSRHLARRRSTSSTRRCAASRRRTCRPRSSPAAAPTCSSRPRRRDGRPCHARRSRPAGTLREDDLGAGRLLVELADADHVVDLRDEVVLVRPNMSTVARQA